MENSGVHQLPEVDSLPDGFVDSTEPSDPQSLTVRHENAFCSEAEDDPTAFVKEKSTHGTFRMAMYEKNGLGLSDTSVLSEEVSDYDPSNHDQNSAAIPDSSDLLSDCFDRVVGCSEVSEVPASCQSSDRSSESLLTPSAKGISLQERVELPKEKKQENAETKRKNSKKPLLSENEILELTLKYQCALNERDAAITVRDKLESLCRELQRQNKMLTDECKRISTEGKNLRLDLSARFQDAIKDVGIKLEEQKEDCISQMKENDMLRNKLKQFADQYALTEQQFQQKLKQRQLELELAELKNKQYEEKLIQEQSQMKTYADQISQLLATEKALRLQLTSDGEKFQQFQEALIKSNEVFETFKLEIEKMAKSIKEHKKENRFLKSKCQKSDVTLIELVEEREMLKKQLEKTKNQKEKLESLCRSLQAERKQSSSGTTASDAIKD